TTAPAADVVSTAMFAGQVMVGSVQLTVTLKLQLVTAPPEPVASQVTRVVPCGNVLPDAGVEVTASARPQPSSAVGWKLTAMPPGLLVLRTMSAGQVTMGAHGHGGEGRLCSLVERTVTTRSSPAPNAAEKHGFGFA